MHQRVNQVLHAVQHQRTFRIVGDADQPLQAQKVLPLQRRDVVEPGGEGRPLDRLVDDDAVGLDAVVAAMIMMVVMVLVIATGASLLHVFVSRRLRLV